MPGASVSSKIVSLSKTVGSALVPLQKTDTFGWEVHAAVVHRVYPDGPVP